MGGIELIVAERVLLPFPLRDGPQSVADEEGTPSRGGHPRRDADALLRRRGENLVVHICGDGDRELG
jgi:hypothetical protein